MKICLISVVTYWHGVKGGMEVHERILARELAARGHDVTVMTSRHPSGLKSERREGVEIHYLQATVFGSQRGNWASECERYFQELHHKKAFEIVCCQHMVVPSGLIGFAQQQEVPIVVITEGLSSWMLLSEVSEALSHHKGYGRLWRRLGAFLYYYLGWELPVARRCDALIAVSNEVARSIPKWCWVSHHKVHTVYNGVDVEAFAPDPNAREAVRKSYQVSSGDRLIVFLSHVTRQKGLHLLIGCLPDILANAGRVKLLVAGEGEYLAEARQFVNTLGLGPYVAFAGHVPHERSPGFLNAADLFVLPTLRQEGMPFALLEAMACQKPVIASRIGGIPSVVEHGVNGLLVSPGNRAELGNAILRLLGEGDLADRLSRKARETVVSDYSIGSMVGGTLKVFEEAIKGKRTAGLR